MELHHNIIDKFDTKELLCAKNDKHYEGAIFEVIYAKIMQLESVLVEIMHTPGSLNCIIIN
jgi:hypothetical protein